MRPTTCARRRASEFGWYNRNCAINPVLVEGKKTAGLEVAEQWRDLGGVPDWVAVSVGDGCTIAGIWKGLQQMHELGVIDRLPRLLGVQAAQVKPIEYAMRARRAAASRLDGQNDRRQHRRPRAAQLAEGGPRDPRFATACWSASATTRFWTRCDWPGRHGVFAEPAAAAALAGVVSAIDSKTIGPHDRVLVMITGSGLKDTRSAIRAGGQPIAIEPTVAAVETDAMNRSHARGAESAEKRTLQFDNVLHCALRRLLREL